jgi:hypothetical protein
MPPQLMQTAPGAQRGYQLAPPTTVAEIPDGRPNRLILWAALAVILVVGALAGVYFGVLKKSSTAPAPAPAVQPR